MTYRMYDGWYTVAPVPAENSFAVDVDRGFGEKEHYLFLTLEAALLYVLNANKCEEDDE